jgi:serine protease Do
MIDEYRNHLDDNYQSWHKNSPSQREEQYGDSGETSGSVTAAPAAQEQSQPRDGRYTTVAEIRGRSRGAYLGRIFSIVLAAIAIALLGFGGGMIAANQMGEKLEGMLAENFSQLLADAGGAVLYRSVDTNISQTAEQPGRAQLSVAEVAELCADSVVEIQTETAVSGWGMLGLNSYLLPGAGSGVVLTENGYILTCAHVIANAKTIAVRLSNGETYPAELIAADEQSDVAIIKIERTELTPAVMGSSDLLQTGDGVVAIGNPLGKLGGSVTNGIISALDREVTIQGSGTFNVLQTNTAINSGNSGGGLFNMQGELIGMVNAKASDVGVEGLAFALPTDDIRVIIEDLLNYGYVANRAVKLGVTMVNIQDERAAANYRVEEFGCYILLVNDNSNASYAGLESGDRIINADGEDIDTAEQVVAILADKRANDILELVIERNGQRMTFEITLYAVLPQS